MTKPRRSHPMEWVQLDPHTVEQAKIEYDDDQYWENGRAGYREALYGIVCDFEQAHQISSAQKTAVENIMNYNAGLRAGGVIRRRERPIATPPPGREHELLPTPPDRPPVMAPGTGHLTTTKEELPMPTPPATSPSVPPTPAYLIGLATIVEAWGLRSPSRIASLIKAGKFPRPFRGTGRAARWDSQVIEQWKIEHPELLEPRRHVQPDAADVIGRLRALEDQIADLRDRVDQLERGVVPPYTEPA